METECGGRPAWLVAVGALIVCAAAPHGSARATSPAATARAQDRAAPAVESADPRPGVLARPLAIAGPLGVSGDLAADPAAALWSDGVPMFWIQLATAAPAGGTAGGEASVGCGLACSSSVMFDLLFDGRAITHGGEADGMNPTPDAAADPAAEGTPPVGAAPPVGDLRDL